jgi:acetyltransferase-like isoleucine patch superfamily enzyme
MGAQLVPSIHPSAVLEHSGGLSLPPSTHIEAGCVISLGERAHLRLGERNTFYPHVVIRLGEGWMETGHEVSLGPGVKIYETRAGLRIGNHCMLAAGVCICGVQHGFDDCSRPMRQQPVLALPVVLEDDVWIGMNAVVQPGVTIGAHSVIGSGSVVTRSIPAWSIAYGVPCRVQRRRDRG